MSRLVIGRGMYGMWGPITDSGEREFTAKVAALGADVGASPYRDYQVNDIVTDLRNAPETAIKLIWGSSLGACNVPLVVLYAKPVIIHGAFGFQASLNGADVAFAGNCMFAHEFWNSIWADTVGMGALQWHKPKGQVLPNLYTTDSPDFHPGETEHAQAVFIAEMQRIIANPGD